MANNFPRFSNGNFWTEGYLIVTRYKSRVVLILFLHSQFLSRDFVPLNMKTRLMLPYHLRVIVYINYELKFIAFFFFFFNPYDNINFLEA